MSAGRLLETINSPEDIKKLTDEQITQLAGEIRELLIKVVSTNGGHLAPNLGVVELTLALHKVFSTPREKIFFDVGHQSYIHKIIKGRSERFATMRCYGGLSGFPKRNESEHDAFGTGHSSTSISAAVGMAVARDLRGEDYDVVAVIGDGSMTGGMAFEALNNAGFLHKKMIVVLNDNEMSISKNVGAMSKYLYRLRTDDRYRKIRNNFESWLQERDFGADVLEVYRRVKGSVKYLMVPTSVFEELGFTYLGPVDGHDYHGLVEVLEAARRVNGPVMVHVLTTKGKGYAPAEANPNAFHGTGPFEIASGQKITSAAAPRSYTEVFGSTLVELAAAFAKAYPQRFIDVGFAEQHAVTAAAGMAAAGMLPVVAIYSTFMQRAYDSVLHDICMQNLHVVLCLDRAGLVGDDGYTHHGVFDYAYLRSMPNMTLMAPKDENELRHMLQTALEHDGPVAVRYPRGSGVGVELAGKPVALPLGKAEVLRSGSGICLWAIGSMVQIALEAAELLAGRGIDAGVVNMRFAKPLDRELLLAHAQQYRNIVVVEEGAVAGGVGSAVLETLNAAGLLGQCRVLTLGIGDSFVTHGGRQQLLQDLQLDAKSVADRAEALLREAGQ